MKILSILLVLCLVGCIGEPISSIDNTQDKDPNDRHWTDGLVIFNLVPLQPFKKGDIQTFEVSTNSQPMSCGVKGVMTVSCPSGYLLYFNEQPGWVTSFKIYPKDFQGIMTIYGKTIKVKCVTGGSGNIIANVKDGNDVIHNAPIAVVSVE